MKLFPILRSSRKFYYEIPDRYQDTLYVANSSLFHVVGYFVHKTYEKLFSELVTTAKSIRPTISDDDAVSSVRDKIKQMEYCDQFVDMNISVERKHGSCDIIRAMRVYHGLELSHGFALGGLRLCQDLRRHTEQGYAIHATYRNACYELEIGGAHGGLKICSLVYEPEELKAALEKFTSKLSEYRGVVDIIEPDIFAGSSEMHYINEVCGDNVLVMGKPATQGGLPDYETAASKTVLLMLKYFLTNEDLMKRFKLEGSIANKSFIIHGLGRSGIDIATEMCKAGAICVGIKDENCSMYDEGGIPFKALMKHYKKYGTMMNFSTKAIEGDVNRIYTDPCDILILASSERAISCSIADNVKAKVIVEACNGPITPGADRILLGKSKLIIPSILAGGGYSYMSYLEYLHNAGVLVDGENPDEKVIKAKVYEQFDTKINELTKEIFDIEKDMNLCLDFRTAAYVKAIRWIFKKLFENEEVSQVEEKERQVIMQYK